MFSVMAAQWTAVRPGRKEEGEEERYADVSLGVCLHKVSFFSNERHVKRLLKSKHVPK